MIVKGGHQRRSLCLTQLMSCDRRCHFDAIHYDDVIMSAIASQITSLTIVYSIVYSDADQRKHQSSASLAFVQGIHRGPVNSPDKWPVTRKMFPFDDVIMNFIPVCQLDPLTSKRTRLQEMWRCRRPLRQWYHNFKCIQCRHLFAKPSATLTNCVGKNQSSHRQPYIRNSCALDKYWQ